MKKTICILCISSLPVLVLAQMREGEVDGDGRGSYLPAHASWLIYTALLVSVFAIALQLISRRSSSKPKEGSLNTDKFTPIQRELTSLRTDLSAKIGRIELDGLAGKVKFLEERIGHLERPVREVEWTGLQKNPLSAETESSVVLSPEPAPAEQHMVTWFAKLADLEDGFSSGVLSTVQNGEQIYEIRANGDTAVYRISGDPSAQKYALAEFAFTLGKACDLLNQPFKGCHITLQKEGALVNTSGNWIIQEKAKIEFK